MKKLILILFIGLFSLTVSANDTTKTNIVTIPDTSKLTLNKVYEDVKEGLKVLGSALKVGSEHVYEVLIKQQIVKSITKTIQIIIFIVLIIIGIKFTIKRYAFYIKNRDDVWDSPIESASGWGMVLSAIVTLICSILLIISIVDIDIIITGFVNPEYGALKDIMNFVNNKTN